MVPNWLYIEIQDQFGTKSLGIKKMESPVYDPRGNELAEKVHTVNRSLRRGDPVSRALTTHRKASNTGISTRTQSVTTIKN